MGRAFRRASFAPGATLAWMLDREQGYRDASQWELKEICGLSGARGGLFTTPRLDLADVLTGERDLPQVTIVPTNEPGKLWVRSSESLVIQEPGAPSPLMLGDSARVGYGTVLRSGALLVAILDEGEAEALRQGGLELPVIGEATTVALSPEEAKAQEQAAAEILQELRRARRLRGTVAALVVALLTGGGLALRWGPLREIVARVNLRPDRVMVVVRSDRQAIRRPLRDTLTGQLQGLGLTVVAPDAGEDRPLSDPIEALTPLALRLGAQHVLLLRADLEGGGRGGRQAGAALSSLSSQVLSIVDPRGSPSTEVGDLQELTLTERRFNEEGVISEEQEHALEALWTEIAAQLIESSPLVGYAEQVAAMHEPPRGGPLLLRARQAAKARRRLEGEITARCEALGREVCVPVDREAFSLRLLTDPCGEQYPVGVTSKGSAALVQVTEDHRYFTFGSRPTVQRFDGPDQLDLVELGSGRRCTIDSAPSYDGAAAMSADGRVLYLIEGLDRRSSLLDRPRFLKIDIETNERRVLGWSQRLWLSYSTEEALRASHDGRWVAFLAGRWGLEVPAEGLPDSLEGFGALLAPPPLRVEQGQEVLLGNEAGLTKVRAGPAGGARWVELSLPGLEGETELLAVTVIRDQRWQTPRGEEPDLIGRWYRSSGTPLHPHIALYEPETALLMHLGEETHPAVGLFGVLDGRLLYSYRRPLCPGRWVANRVTGRPECDATPGGAEDHRECGLALFDPMTRAYEYRRTEGCFDEGWVLGGEIVLTLVEEGEVSHLARIDSETGGVERVTTGPWAEGAPVLSREGAAALFARRAEIEGLRRPVVVTCLLERR